MAKVKELRDLPVQELLSRLETNKEELFALRFQFATGQLDNPMRIKTVRHDVARILTILRERELEAELQAHEAEMVHVGAEGSRSEAVSPAGGSAKRSLLRKKKEKDRKSTRLNS